MGNGPDSFVVTEARNETMVDDLEDASFMLNCSIGSLIEKAARVPVTLRRAWAVIHSRALFLSRACPHSGGESLGGSKSRCLSTHLSNDLLRQIHPETGDFGQPLDCILMLPEQTCDLLVQLADLLLDPLQLLERHLHQPAVNRAELRTRTQCIAQLRRRGAQALAKAAKAAGSVSPSANACSIRVHLRRADPKPNWTT